MLSFPYPHYGRFTDSIDTHLHTTGSSLYAKFLPDCLRDSPLRTDRKKASTPQNSLYSYTSGSYKRYLWNLLQRWAGIQRRWNWLLDPHTRNNRILDSISGCHSNRSRRDTWPRSRNSGWQDRCQASGLQICILYIELEIRTRKLFISLAKQSNTL